MGVRHESSVIFTEVTEPYRWPAAQYYPWYYLMGLTTLSVLGLSAYFIDVQNRLDLFIPWFLPYILTVACVLVVFLILLHFLVKGNNLIPTTIMTSAVAAFALWMVGLVVVGLYIWGPSGAIHEVCQRQVFSESRSGDSLATLAWMHQRTICQSWYALFSLELVGALLLLWIFFLSMRVWRA